MRRFHVNTNTIMLCSFDSIIYGNSSQCAIVAAVGGGFVLTSICKKPGKMHDFIYALFRSLIYLLFV